MSVGREQPASQASAYSNKQGVIKRSNIRIVDGFSLASLSFAAVAFLWLVSINQSMLVDLIERSESSTVSLAFLTALEEKSEDEQKISVELLQLEHYLRLNRLEDATKLLHKLQLLATAENDSALDAKLLAYAMELLLKQYQQATEQQQPLLLKAYENLLPELAAHDYALARQYADGALALTRPDLAHVALLPYADNPVERAELLNLALQHENYPQALVQQQLITERQPSVKNLAQLSQILQALNSQQADAFFADYQGSLLNQPAFLLLGLEQSHRSQNATYRDPYYRALKAQKANLEQREKVAQQALASGDLALAQRYYRDLALDFNRDEHLAQLHDIYLWQQNIRRALGVTQQRVRFNASNSRDEELLRTGLNEAIALGDYIQAQRFYQLLDQAGHLSSKEKVSYVDLTEKVRGSQAALVLVSRLVKTERGNIDLLDQQAQLAMGLGEYSLLPNIWQGYINNGAVNKRRALDFSEAYVQQPRPDAALAVMVMPRQWQRFDDDYLERVMNLAWQEGEIGIARQVQQAQMQRPGYSLLDANHMYRFSKLYQPLSSLGSAKLFVLYQLWPQPDLLYAALALAIKQGDQAAIAKAIKLAEQNPALEQKAEFVYLRTLLAMEAGDKALVNDLFETLLAQSEQQEDINTYLWWLIDSEQYDLLSHAYRRYSLPSVRSLQLEPNSYLSQVDWQTLMVLAASAQHLDKPYHVQKYLAAALDHIDPEQDFKALSEAGMAYAGQLNLQGMTRSSLLLRQLVWQGLQAEPQTQFKGNTELALSAAYASGNDHFSLLKNKALAEPTQANYLSLIDYFINRGDIHNVDFWLEKTGLRSQQLSDGQQLILALRKNDKPELERLLAESSKLSPADHNATLQNLARFEEAWQLAQQQLGTLGNALEERQLFRQIENLRSWKANSVGLRIEALTHWDIQTFSSFSYIPTDNGQWRIQLDQQQAGDITPLSTGDSDEKRLRIHYQWQTRYGEKSRVLEARFELDVADGLGDQRLGLDLGLDIQLDDYWRVGASLEFQAHSELSRLAYLAARDNRLQLRASYQPTRRQQVSMQLTAHDLETRFGDQLASGFDAVLRFSERVFFADPAMELYLSLSTQQLDLSSDNLDGINQAFALPPANRVVAGNFVEDSFSQIRIGQRLSSEQFMTAGIESPIDRYWLDTSIGFDSNSHFTTNISAGMGWRIFNHDEVSLSFDWQSRDVNGDAAAVIALGYYHNY